MKKLSILFLLFVVVGFWGCRKEKRLITQRAYVYQVEKMFGKTRELAKHREKVLFSVMDSGLSAEERDGMMFLLGFAPLSDLADYDGGKRCPGVRSYRKMCFFILYFRCG
ncbi:MAG: hypothetical protein NTU44_06610 [Bacteroidetes bacterium]|nr:hypothetical protein [Bacteroidota bacterium]